MDIYEPGVDQHGNLYIVGKSGKTQAMDDHLVINMITGVARTIKTEELLDIKRIDIRWWSMIIKASGLKRDLNISMLLSSHDNYILKAYGNMRLLININEDYYLKMLCQRINVFRANIPLDEEEIQKVAKAIKDIKDLYNIFYS